MTATTSTSATSSSQPVDFLTNEARKRASRVAPEDLQRELLAQNYLQNHFVKKQHSNLITLKNQMTFFVVVAAISLAIGIIALLNI